MTDAARVLEQLRAICLALPESTEKIAWGDNTFRVRDKIFAHFVNNHHGDGIVAVWCKAPPGMQQALVGSAPDRFFVPPYVGPRGWVGLHLDRVDVDWDEVAGTIEESYALVAPKRLLAQLDAEAGTTPD